MEDNIVEAQIDEHLMNIQRDTKSALDRFIQTGLKIDRKFMNHFQNVTVDRVTQTCKRFEAEARWKIPRKKAQDAEKDPEPLFDLTNEVPNDSPNKRKLENADASTEEAKKMKLNETVDPDPKEVREDLLCFPETTRFFCVHCLDQSDANKAFNGTVEDVYEHWLVSHASNSISRPFQFYAVAVSKCYYCDQTGTYHELLKHQEEQHPQHAFIIIDQIDHQKCGICHYRHGDLAAHFKKCHDSIFPLKVFNPAHFTEEKLTELLAINVFKRYQCAECSKMFETMAEVTEHFQVSHDGNEAAWSVVEKNRDTPVYLICGYCQMTVECNGYLNHFKEHSYNFNCSKCTRQSQDLAELIFHERIQHKIDTKTHHFTAFPDWVKNKFLNTKMVFFNGLVLKNYNVLRSKYDESKLFAVFTEGLLDLMKERLKQMIKNNEIKTERDEPKEDIKAIQQTSSDQHHTNDPKFMEHLMEQRKLANNLRINGIKQKQGNAHEIFLSLCNKLKVKVCTDDIARAEFSGNNIIVKLNESPLKNIIMYRMKDINIWSNDLVKLSRGEAPRKIHVGHHLTPFYTSLWQFARKLKDKKVLHSFRLSRDGLVVQRYASGGERICLSKKQISDYVDYDAE